MMNDEEVVRSIRRAAIVGDRTEVLATTGYSNFTIKDARDLLKGYGHLDHTVQMSQGNFDHRPFVIAETAIIHYLWRKFFPDYEYHTWDDTYGNFMRYTIEWVKRDETDILLEARQRGPLRGFVKAVREALIVKGLIEPKGVRDRDRHLYHRMTEDGVLLTGAAWYAQLTKAKADSLIKGVVDRAVAIAQNPNDYLAEVTLLGVFGSYMDERVIAYNDVDIIYDTRAFHHDPTRNMSFNKWLVRAEQLFKKDNRTYRGLFQDSQAWPEQKVGIFLRSRKPQLRVHRNVTQPIRIKILYQLPKGVLDTPYVIELPECGTSSAEWEALRRNAYLSIADGVSQGTSFPKHLIG